jgi:hypothetical protein
MAFNDAALIVGATAMRNVVTHFQLHSGAPGAAGTTNVTTAARQPTGTGTIDADGDITWGPVNFTGVAANGAVTHVTYWSAITGGTIYGQAALTGDATANAAGEYTVTSVTETSTAT